MWPSDVCCIVQLYWYIKSFFRWACKFTIPCFLTYVMWISAASQSLDISYTEVGSFFPCSKFFVREFLQYIDVFWEHSCSSKGLGSITKGIFNCIHKLRSGQRAQSNLYFRYATFLQLTSRWRIYLGSSTCCESMVNTHRSINYKGVSHTISSSFNLQGGVYR